MTGLRISKFFRIRPEALIERDAHGDESLVAGPPEFEAQLRPGIGIVVASWDSSQQLGCASRFGIVLGTTNGGARVRWSRTDAVYRPKPSGRQFWTQPKPFFGFALAVAERYLLVPAFAEHFPGDIAFDASELRSSKGLEAHPSGSPTGGYVYLIRSQYGYKIGKSINVKSRTRLFEVKLPFPITVAHYAWFDDYTYAERRLHLKFHAKRLEGEWFDLSEADVAHIKTLGKAVQDCDL